MNVTMQRVPFRLSEQQKRYRAVKRIIDTLLALMAIPFLLLPIVCVAVVMKLVNPGESVFFLQERIGMNEKVFYMVKFRTMRAATPENVPTSQLDHPEGYYLRLGQFLRRTSIDELPQIYNVLRGEMALIGPRPLLPEEEPIQTLRKENGVYQIRPGITGLAQINGRDYLSDDKKIRYDCAYLEHFSFLQDIGILFHSVSYVLAQRGIKGD